MLLTERPGTLLGGIRSTAVNERRIRADRFGPRSSTAACASAAGTSTRSRMEGWFSSGPVIPAHPPGPAPGSGGTLANAGVAQATERTRETATAVASKERPTYRLRIFAPVQTIRCGDHGPVLIARRNYVPVSMACPRTFVVSWSPSQMRQAV